MRYAFLVPTFAAAALLLASCSDAEEELPQDAEQAVASATATPSPAIKGRLWRWVNVTLVLPELSPATIGRGTIPDGLKGAGGPGMGPTIDHGDPEAASYVIIDAVTGEILQDHVSLEDREAIDEILKTLAVTPFDEAEKGWPYADTLPADAERRAEFGISYVLPDPASGIDVGAGIADPCCPFIKVSNGRSTVFVLRDEETKTISREPVALSAQDESPFERFLSAVKACGPDIKC